MFVSVPDCKKKNLRTDTDTTVTRKQMVRNNFANGMWTDGDKRVSSFAKLIVDQLRFKPHLISPANLLLFMAIS